MNLIRLFPLVLFLFSQSAWATSVFAGDDCVKCGTGLPGGVVKSIHPEDKLLICMEFEAGQLNGARNTGIRLYGNVETFYAHMHEIQCPPNAPSPIYSAVNVSLIADGYPQIFKDLAKLSPDVRARLLNRPTTGRRKETILDMLDRRMNLATGTENVFRILKNKRDQFAELGAKKLSEMSPEERAVYE